MWAWAVYLHPSKHVIKAYIFYSIFSKTWLTTARRRKEEYGNFMQLLKLKGEDDPLMSEWLKRKMNKYTTHEIQDSISKVIATHILKDISESIRLSPFIAVMMDEATDISNKEQATIVIRSLNNVEVNEEFIGLFEVPSIDSKTLAFVLKDSL